MTHHILTLWNPSYADDAMEQHLALLLDRARMTADGQLAREECYVWWGRVRSQHRLQRAPNQESIEAIARALDADEAGESEIQLYLTDFRSLYVANVGDITIGELEPAEQGNTPVYYRTRGLHCDYWFLLYDIRALVLDDLTGVGAELRKLRNVHYHDKPVSLYGGMVDLPLIVSRPDGQQFFDPAERDAITEGRLWAEWDAEQGGGVAAMERELHDNVIGDRAWQAMEPSVRRFIATGEKLFREHRNDPAFDFGPVLNAFAKALEIQCRASLRQALQTAPRQVRQVNVEGRTVDLLEVQRLTLGQLAHVLGTEQALATAVTAFRHDRGWFTGQLPSILAAFANVRNEGTHELRITRATATEWRDRLLGVGTDGIFVHIVGGR